MSDVSEETLRWQVARIAVWTAIVGGVLAFWGVVAALLWGVLW